MGFPERGAPNIVYRDIKVKDMDDALQAYLEEIVRHSVPESWEVRVYKDKRLIGIDDRANKIGWGLSWTLNDQSLKIACGTSSMTVNLARPESKDQLIEFFKWLTNWPFDAQIRRTRPKGLVTVRLVYDEEDE